MLNIYNQSNMSFMLEFKDKTHVHIPRYGQVAVDSKYKDEVIAHKASGVNITFAEDAATPPAKRSPEPTGKQGTENSGSKRKGGTENN